MRYTRAFLIAFGDTGAYYRCIIKADIIDTGVYHRDATQSIVILNVRIFQANDGEDIR